MGYRTNAERERLRAFLENPVPFGGIGPRVVQLPRQLACVEPDQYRCSRLAAQLADEWVEYVAATGLRTHARNYQQAIDGLCRHIDEELGPQAAHLVLESPELLDLLVGWETSLPEQRAAGSQRPAALASATRVLIVRRADHADRKVATEVERFARGRMHIRAGKTTERDEFTRREKRTLVRAAWHSAHTTKRRLEEGWAQAATGCHPDEGSWTSVPDLLWGLSHQRITPTDIRVNLPKMPQWPDELLSFAMRGGPLQLRTAGRQLIIRLVAALYPTTRDLHAYRVLLMDATGYASEEVTSFGESQVEFLPKGVRLTMLKLRAEVLRHRAFRDRPPEPELGEEEGKELDLPEQLDIPSREASAVVRHLLEVTAAARGRTPQITDTLFVRAAVRSDFTLVFDRWAPELPGSRFAEWLAAVGVVVKGDQHIGRLRKSTKVEKAIVTGGRISAVADDHTEETFAGHYAQGTTMRILSGRTIATAQQHWFDKALGQADSPTLVDGNVDENRLQEAGLSVREAEEIMSGQLDVGVSHCRSPRQSPFARPGELCPVMPLSCLECGNAWILPSNLPQLLLFKAHMERVRASLPPPVFDKLWGQRWRNLHAVLDSRTEAELTQAHGHIRAGNAVLDLPLRAYTEFDA